MELLVLQVRARVGVSQIHGFGLFATEHIHAGQVVWEMREGFDLCFSARDLAELSDASREQILHYCDGDLDPQSRKHVLSADDARFTNHSDNPNTASADGGRVTVALRDIAPGEEITWRYFSDDTASASLDSGFAAKTIGDPAP